MIVAPAGKIWWKWLFDSCFLGGICEDFWPEPKFKPEIHSTQTLPVMVNFKILFQILFHLILEALLQEEARQV